MTTKQHTKFAHPGEYAAEVLVELIPGAEPWGPYLSLDDARKLERVRLALEQGDLKAASLDAQVYRLVPVEAA